MKSLHTSAILLNLCFGIGDKVPRKPTKALKFWTSEFLPRKRFDRLKMVGTNATMIAIRMVRSKLRKRDENTGQQNHVILHSAQQQNNNHCHHNNNNSGTTTPPNAANGGTTFPTVSATIIYPPPAPPATDTTAAANGLTVPRQFIWQIPTTHPFALYSNDKVCWNFILG